jgi:putative membrane protein
MKTLSAYIIGLSSLLLLSQCSPSDKDSVKQAHNQNLNSAIDEDISNYMTQAADSRMTNIEEGKLAKTKGSSQAVRSYGEDLLTVNTKMLHDIRVLAASKNIALPNFLSNKNAKALEDLREKDGEQFDQAFLKLMRKSHKRDIAAFDDATDYKDQDIQKFAANRIGVLRTQLESVENLEANREHVSSRSTKDDDN